jgi:hypothetical protein
MLRLPKKSKNESGLKRDTETRLLSTDKIVIFGDAVCPWDFQN